MADITSQLIRDREGYRSTPYWDVNAWRVGYGSDTLTDADGTIRSVTKNSRTTREDAERDLARRIPEFQRDGIIAYVGQDAWNSLGEGAKAAVTSLAYNYGGLGKLPSLQKAIRSGNNDTIAQAILARGADNDGVNDERRRAEAAIVLGHPVPGGRIPGQTNFVQERLAARGFSPGPIDGINGPQTKAAVRAFQQANGLTVDGIVGPQTLAALNGSSRPQTQRQPGANPMFGRPQPPALPSPGMLSPQHLGNDVGFGPGSQLPGGASQRASSGNFLGGLMGMLGNKYNQATNALGTAAQAVQNAPGAAQQTLGGMGQEVAARMVPEMMGTVKGRTLMANALMGVGTRSPAERMALARQTNPGTWGFDGEPPAPSPTLHIPAQSNRSQLAAALQDRRARQIAEGKASQLDQFGMIR